MILLTKELLRAGSVVSFLYPAANFSTVRRPKMERRRLRVDRVRLLDDNPLDSFTLEAEPDLRRGQTLITGYDLDKQAERSFYAESMREVRECIAYDLEPHIVELLETDSDPEPMR